MIFQDGRSRRKNGKAWFVFDTRRFVEVITEAKARGLNDCDHQGKTMWRNADKVIVVKTGYCCSEDQARMLASNGGTWAEFKKRNKLGERRSSKYFDRTRYACVELTVVNVMYTQRVVEWNAGIIRDELFREQGESVLPKLCSSYKPPTPADCADLDAESSSAVRSIHYEPPKPVKPTLQREYVIVDQDELDELRFRRDEMKEPELAGLTDVDLLKRSICSQTFKAANPRQAMEKYLYKVHPDASGLPSGRFVAIAESLYERVISTLTFLPRLIARETLLYELKRRGNDVKVLEDEPVMQVGDDPAGLVQDTEHDRLLALKYRPKPKQLNLLSPEFLEHTNLRPYCGPPPPRRRPGNYRIQQLRLQFPPDDDAWKYIT